MSGLNSGRRCIIFDETCLDGGAGSRSGDPQATTGRALSSPGRANRWWHRCEPMPCGTGRRCSPLTRPVSPTCRRSALRRCRPTGSSRRRGGRRSRQSSRPRRSPGARRGRADRSRYGPAAVVFGQVIEVPCDRITRHIEVAVEVLFRCQHGAMVAGHATACEQARPPWPIGVLPSRRTGETRSRMGCPSTTTCRPLTGA